MTISNQLQIDCVVDDLWICITNILNDNDSECWRTFREKECAQTENGNIQNDKTFALNCFFTVRDNDHVFWEELIDILCTISLSDCALTLTVVAMQYFDDIDPQIIDNTVYLALFKKGWSPAWPWTKSNRKTFSHSSLKNWSSYVYSLSFVHWHWLSCIVMSIAIIMAKFKGKDHDIEIDRNYAL